MLDRCPARAAMRARCQLVAPRAQKFLHPTQISLRVVQISLDNFKNRLGLVRRPFLALWGGLAVAGL